MSNKPAQNQQSNGLNSGSPMPGEPEYLAVGKLRRPHGLGGEMLFMVWTDFPERLKSRKQVFVGNSYQPFTIKNMRGHGQKAMISFEECRNREEVAKLRNQVVFVRTSDISSLPNDEIYLHQLLGMQIISDKDYELLGIVVEILETGANQVFVVRRDGKQDILIPDIDPVILKIDVEKKEILVHLLPGLIPDESLPV